jgi:hypothetical protein
MRVVKKVVVSPSGFSFQLTLGARSVTEWSGVARDSGGLTIRPQVGFRVGFVLQFFH